MAEVKPNKLTELLHGTDTAMLITHDGKALDGRPMQIASIEDNDTLLFATAVGSAKVREIHDNRDVALAFMAERCHVFLRGTADFTQHKGLIDRLWSESWKAWYPKGKDDPTLCILVFHPAEAVFWDDSGRPGQHHAFGGTSGPTQAAAQP